MNEEPQAYFLDDDRPSAAGESIPAVMAAIIAGLDDEGEAT